MGLDLTGIGSVADLAKGIIDKFWPDKTEAQKAEMAQAMVLLQGQLNLAQGQLDVNKAEAASSSTFVAGWRPFIGWVCGTALVYQYILRPFVEAGFALAHQPIPALPGLDGNLYELLLGMLGLGAFRTYEKVRGVAK